MEHEYQFLDEFNRKKNEKQILSFVLAFMFSKEKMKKKKMKNSKTKFGVKEKT